MDETIKIYRVRCTTSKRDVVETHEPISTWCQVIKKNEDAIRELGKKYPWAVIFYNWLVLSCVIALAVSFVLWGISIHTEKTAAAFAATALADYQADQEERAREEQAALLAVQNSEAAKKEKDIILMAKFLEGLSGFVKNKGYNDVDLYTYAQCPLNRILNPAFWCTTLEEALRQENQWVGYYETNQVTASNKALATRIINEFYDEETRPCGYEYCWTEFTDKGLYLKSDFGPATFNNTWRAKG